MSVTQGVSLKTGDPVVIGTEAELEGIGVKVGAKVSKDKPINVPNRDFLGRSRPEPRKLVTPKRKPVPERNAYGQVRRDGR